jgi:hypothetical protein
VLLFEFDSVGADLLLANGADQANPKAVIIGYNTDVKHDGVVYHVQTEDKGTGTPLILSLVYVGGAILASKRSRYDDLMTAGFDEGILADRLQRQHKLICAAIHAGRIEDLRRLSHGELAGPPAVSEVNQETDLASPFEAEEAEAVTASVVPEATSVQPPEAKPETFAVAESAAAADQELRVTLLDERELHSGEFATVRILVSRGSGTSQRVVPNTRVVLKTLGSTFRPASTSALTDQDGVALVLVSLPAFKSGRAAVLVRADVDGEIAELRRIILPQ